MFLTCILLILDNIELTSRVKHSLCINLLSDNHRSMNHFIQNLAHYFNISTILYNQLIINNTYFQFYIYIKRIKRFYKKNYRYSLTYINY